MFVFLCTAIVQLLVEFSKILGFCFCVDLMSLQFIVLKHFLEKLLKKSFSGDF